MTYQAPPKREWPLGFCDCCSHGIFPNFIPKAVCGTCFIVGESLSNLKDEEVKCCNMGSSGICCCLISVPINIAGPLGGFCWFAGHSMQMRSETAAKYNIDDDNYKVTCCCISCPSWVVGECRDFI